MHQGNLDLTLNEITKIEGHASLTLKIRGGKVKDLQFQIAEYKRFYTQAIRGKHIGSIPSMVSRICGTCSNAHLLCSIIAIENALKIQPTKQTKLLRRLLMNGLMIRDHGLHLYLFALPDIFGKDSLLSFDENNPQEHQLLHDAFDVKESGNQLGIWAGGRSVHAPNPQIGGFRQLPPKEKIPSMIAQLESVRPAVLRLIDVFEKCEFVQKENFKSCGLCSEDYDFLHGNIKTGKNEVILEADYGQHLKHQIIPYSQASGYKFDGQVMLVGALARLNLNSDALHSNTQKDTQEVLKRFPSDNIYDNNLAQAIEILHCIDDSINILRSLDIHPEAPLKYQPVESEGVGVIEAPRGTLYYRLVVDGRGNITEGKIVVPTGQNQICIEQSLLHFVESHLELPKEKLSLEFEKIVRAYDPCMSCASHFLKLKYT